MVGWYRLAQLFLWTSVFCSCVLMFFAIYSPETNSRSSSMLLVEQKLPHRQSLNKRLTQEQFVKKQLEYRAKSTDYTKVLVEPHPRYRLPYNLTVQGQAFPLSEALLRYYHLDNIHTLKQVPDDVRDRLVLVTAASSGFYNGAMSVIAGTQLYFPNHTMLVYDLGGGASLQQMVESNVNGTPCQVQFRMFNFTKYPSHVKSLKTYAWKFLIIKEVLETFDALFWLDSSIHLEKTLPRSLPLHSSPIRLMAYTGHSNYAVTHPHMYQFFPTDTEKQKKTLQYEANSMLIVNTKAAFERVLKWTYLCSLVEQCIAPQGSTTGCTFNGDSFTKHTGGCHRFDQAAVNILLGNSMNFDYPSYVFNNGDYEIFKVHRGQSSSGVIKTCGR